MTARSFRLEQTAVKCFTVSHRAQNAKLRPFVRFLTLHILGSEADLVLAVTMRSKSCPMLGSWQVRQAKLDVECRTCSHAVDPLDGERLHSRPPSSVTLLFAL